MKKTILTLAFIALASQLHASSLGDMVSKIASDLNIRVVNTNTQHVRHHRTDRHKVHKRAHPKRHLAHKRVKKNKTAKRLAHKKARKLNFHTLSEYKRITHRRPTAHRHSQKSKARHLSHRNRKKLGRYVGNGWYSDDDGYYNEEWEDTTNTSRRWRRNHHRKQHGYRHYRRQWYLTFLYERASFYDGYGFHYGDFDRRGFVFDGYFYRYDYNYTYQDRLHGKGIFEHRYYRPIRHRVANRDSFWVNDLFPYGSKDSFHFRVSFK